MQQSLRNICSKFKVDPLNRFRTGARQVFTTNKRGEIPLTMKIAIRNFWSNYHLSNFFRNLWRQKNRYSSKKLNTWAPSGYFPFFISLFCWNEIIKKSSREDKRKIRSISLWILWNFQEHLFLTEHLQWLLLKNGQL